MKDWETRFDGLNIIRITVKVDEDEAFVSTHDESSDIVKDFIRSEKQNLLLQIEEIVGQKKQRSGGETEYWRGFIEGQNSEVGRIREGLNKLKE